jgi:hypothetical protein
LSTAGFVFRGIDPTFLDGRIMAFWVSVVCIVVYVTVSLLGRDPHFDLEGLLHRDRGEKRSPWRFGPEVPRGDRVLIPLIFGVGSIALVTHLAVGVVCITAGVPTSRWLAFWPGYLIVMFTLGTAFLVWITIGGFRDLMRLFGALQRD